MLSPWPPSTKALVFSTETPSSMAMNERMRAVSRMPAMPMTRSRGKPETRRAASHITSSGLVTTISTASGDSFAARPMQLSTISRLLVNRSSRLMPGLRGRPAVITMTSEPAVSA